MNAFDSGFIAEPSNRPALQQVWESTNRAYARLPGPARSFIRAEDIRPLDVKPELQRQTADRVRFYPPFDSHQPEIVAVRLAKLITPQLTVSLPRAARRASIPQGATDAELFKLAFSSSTGAEPIHRQLLAQVPNQGGATIFTSYDEDVRPHLPVYRNLLLEERDPESQILPSLCIPVGGGIPYIMGYRVAIGPGMERIILGNGIHRAFSAAKAGCEWLPLALSRLEPIELGAQVGELPAPKILDPAANPPLITDFTNTAVAMKLEFYPVLRVARVNWNVEQYVTVLR